MIFLYEQKNFEHKVINQSVIAEYLKDKKILRSEIFAISRFFGTFAKIKTFTYFVF